MKQIKIKSGVCPDHLTEGKWYEVVQENGDDGGDIIDDTGRSIYIHYEKSVHLNDGSWEVLEKPEEGVTDGILEEYDRKTREAIGAFQELESEPQFNDDYWFRVYVGQVLGGLSSRPGVPMSTKETDCNDITEMAIAQAESVMAKLKEREDEK